MTLPLRLSVPCELCGHSTIYTRYRRCDRCLDLEQKIQDNLELTLLILQKIFKKKSKISNKSETKCRTIKNLPPLSLQQWLDRIQSEGWGDEAINYLKNQIELNSKQYIPEIPSKDFYIFLSNIARY